MKAIVYERYGPPEVLHPANVAAPVPGRHDVVVRVRATTGSKADIRCRSFDVPRSFWIPARLKLGIFGPRRTILGGEFAGDVAEVGADVVCFKPSDAVFGVTPMRPGAYAEYTGVADDGVIARKPTTMTYDEAAAVPIGARAALHFLTKARIIRGQRVLVRRCVRQRRDLRRAAAREARRCARHGGVQRRESGARVVPRGRHGDRLHQGELCRRRRDVRRRLRGGERMCFRGLHASARGGWHLPQRRRAVAHVADVVGEVNLRRALGTRRRQRDLTSTGEVPRPTTASLSDIPLTRLTAVTDGNRREPPTLGGGARIGSRGSKTLTRLVPTNRGAQPRRATRRPRFSLLNFTEDG